MTLTKKLTPRHIKRAVRRRLYARKDQVWKRAFRLGEKKGLHITPVHYYQPIPDTKNLPDSLWDKESALAGINMRTVAQRRLLARFTKKYRQEYEAFPREPAENNQFYLHNKSYESVDAESYYCLIRDVKPKRIIEIGSGFSTLLANEALAVNAKEGSRGKVTAIEPYPLFDWLKGGLPHLSKVIEKKVEEVPLSEFAKLQAGDMLFIDSTHVVKTGSDVVYEFLEVLPRLPKGVYVHVHDIFFPREVSRHWVKEERRFWNEQYLLQAFLSFNASFEVVWAGHYLHVKHPAELAQAFSSYRDQQANETDRWPLSFWMRKVK